MQRGVMLFALAACVSAENFAEIAARVNGMNKGWRAASPTRFNSTDDVRQLCGTWLHGHPQYVELAEGLHIKTLGRDELPSSFDARAQWPKCSVIRKVRDQSSCGSCWAFGSTETFEDRQCIHRGVDTEMSAEDTASCCSGFDCGFSMGCNGGQPGAALQWMTRTGVVTGGDYGDRTTCRPYTLAPCAHHVPPTAKYPKCPEREYPTPRCTKRCQPTYSTSYDNDKARASRAYSLRSVDAMMSALQQGPLSAAFEVYSDFPTYKSGVYTRTSGSTFLGGHAIEIIGYGTEDSTDYWLVKNSWNEQWGDNGFFKIRRGVNECGIEGSVSAVDF